MLNMTELGDLAAILTYLLNLMIVTDCFVEAALGGTPL